MKLHHVILLVIISILLATLSLILSFLTYKKLDNLESITIVEPSKDDDHKRMKYIKIIIDKYKTDPKLVEYVINTTVKYSYNDFPKTEDLLAVVGIESSWNPNVKSKLKKDKAIGLTQIRPKVWKHIIKNPNELSNVENQIKYSSMILRQYYLTLQDKHATILAYNHGITNLKRGKYNARYLEKFSREQQLYAI